MLFCKKEKKKKHLMLKVMLSVAGAAGVVCLCNMGTKCVCKKMSDLAEKMKSLFTKKKKEMAEILPDS